MKILIAPNSYKGSVDSNTASRAFIEGVRYFSFITNSKVETEKLRVCDGGTGFAETIAHSSSSSRRISVQVHDPLYRDRKSYYYRNKDLAIIESAEVIGYALLTRKELNPLSTSSYGLGQCIAHALDNGSQKILIGCGDSATSDCGLGMLTALGVEFKDEQGRKIYQPCGKHLRQIKHIDFTKSKYYGTDVKIEVACNLTSIAAGEQSTALIYSMQKGASKEEASFLHNEFEKFTRLIGQIINEPHLGLFPGTGAAGGVGFALASFFNQCQLRYSFDVVFDAIEIDKYLRWADIVLTGEGLFDRNSVKGKAPVAVALRAKLFNVITIGIVGAIQSNITSRVLRSGFDIIEPFSAEDISLENYCNNFDDIARDAVVRALMKASFSNTITQLPSE